MGEEGMAMAGREKSSFAVTCSLLSQYLKEKKGGLHGLGMAPPPAGEGVCRPPQPTTMNLLSALDAPPAEPKDAAATDQQSSESAREEAGEEAQQLTIFYGGKVVIFDKFPSTKVQDLLQMVSGGGRGVDTTSSNAPPHRLPMPSHNLSDMPIARRNSLHRFLEKRKGRITAKAPYQVGTSAEAPSADKQATDGEKPWFGLSHEVRVKQEIRP